MLFIFLLSVSLYRQNSSYDPHCQVRRDNKNPVETLEYWWLRVNKSTTTITSLLTTVTRAVSMERKSMHCCIISSRRNFSLTWSQSLPPGLCIIIRKRQRLCRIIRELNLNILQSLFNRIMPLEGNKPSRWTHRTDRSHKRISFTTIIEITCSLRLDSKGQFLNSNILTGIKRINHLILWISNNNEITLIWWACILTPESFEIDCAMIALTPLKPKYGVDFYVWPSLLCVVVLVAATISPIVLETVD